MPPDQPAEAQTAPPFRIEARHIAAQSSNWTRLLFVLVIIGVPLIAAMIGLLGGGEATVTRVAAPKVRVAVETPRVLRSGNWFETQIAVEPSTDIADLAIAIDQPLWRQTSIDTLVPDAEKAEGLDGEFIYSFGPVRAGERFLLKLDGQIQPHWLRRLEGRITIRDGDRSLAAVPVSVLVLP